MRNETDELYQQALDQMTHWDLDEAEHSLRGVLEQDPNNALALNKLGVVYARREEYDKAELYFQQSAQADPNLAAPHSNLGNIFAQRGWTDRAIAAYETALNLDPDYPAALHNLGALYRKSGQIAKGVSLMKRASRAERGRARQEITSSPENRKTIYMGWAIIIGIIIIILYLFRT